MQASVTEIRNKDLDSRRPSFTLQPSIVHGYLVVSSPTLCASTLHITQLHIDIPRLTWGSKAGYLLRRRGLPSTKYRNALLRAFTSSCFAALPKYLSELG
jgi:hypothetical protein